MIQKETKESILAILFFVLAAIFVLAYLQQAGVAGEYVYDFFSYLLGVGYTLLPLLSVLLGIAYIRSHDTSLEIPRAVSGVVFLLSSLALIEIFYPESGGVIGSIIASPLIYLLEVYASTVLLIAFSIISLLVMFEARVDWGALKVWEHSFELPSFALWKRQEAEAPEPTITSGVDTEEHTIDEEAVPSPQEPEESSETKEEDLTVSGITSDPAESDQTADMSDLLNAAHEAEYTPPPISLLQKDSGKPGTGDIKANANIIKRTLQNFNIDVEMDEISIGPTVTRYALKPAEGVRLSKITNLRNNLELALAAHPVRIEAPIPGKALVGIEVPNNKKSTVGLGGLIQSDEFQKSSKPLLIPLGKNISGESYFTDINKMPHLLVAGATGAGKSVTMHSFITSLLYRNAPENLKMIMVDPKRVELTLYNGIPHLLTPVITQAKKSILALKWAAREMDRRYDLLEQNSVRDIASYHKNILNPALKKHKEQADSDEVEDDLPDKMPYIVVFIDELADIMQAYPRELESVIVRLAQMSRAVGIHLIISTQRPSVDVITGLIKANVPARVALQVSSQVDSRTILDTTGAEQLLGAGDMLYQSGDMAKPTRIQSAFISENEVKSVVTHLKKQYEDTLPDRVDISGENEKKKAFEAQLEDIKEDEERDELYEDAFKLVVNAGKASTSYLQRKLRIGYSRAARIMDTLEENGVISEKDGTKARDVLVSKEEYQRRFGSGAGTPAPQEEDVDDDGDADEPEEDNTASE